MKVHSKMGKVFLVGAGPGDPDLITRKGARALEDADVVVYDRLADERLLQLAPLQAERISVAKKGGCYGFPQREINRLLERRARSGQQVVRLKGGDPFLFGRGGEEALYLSRRGIPFEVIPGVSSALAAPAAAGIPLTHRGLSASVTVVTGHLAAGSDVDAYWDNWKNRNGTFVVLMPLGNLAQIVRRLISNGWPMNAPAALVSSGTLSDQRTAVGVLREMPDLALRENIRSPALLIVGETVRLARSLGQVEALQRFAAADLIEAAG